MNALADALARVVAWVRQPADYPACWFALSTDEDDQ